MDTTTLQNWIQRECPNLDQGHIELLEDNLEELTMIVCDYENGEMDGIEGVTDYEALALNVCLNTLRSNL